MLNFALFTSSQVFFLTIPSWEHDVRSCCRNRPAELGMIANELFSMSTGRYRFKAIKSKSAFHQTKLLTKHLGHRDNMKIDRYSEAIIIFSISVRTELIEWESRALGARASKQKSYFERNADRVYQSCNTFSSVKIAQWQSHAMLEYTLYYVGKLKFCMVVMSPTTGQKSRKAKKS